jgi:hypothetical protein
MRRHILTIALVAVGLVAGAAVAATTAGAQEPTTTSTAPPAGASCDGDRVTAAINTQSLPNGGWSVTDACVSARDYFVGSYEDRYPFAIGMSVVPYDDGHTGRLAFLSVQLAKDSTLTVIGMEDPATGNLRFAGSVASASITTQGASVSGQGLAAPPLELATVRLDFVDAPAPWPDWATTTTTTSTTTTTTTTTVAGPDGVTPTTVDGVPATTSVPSTTAPGAPTDPTVPTP